MRLILIAAAALLASACTPMADSPAPSGPGQTADAASCAARGGELRRVGRMQTQQCILKYADANKPCTDNGQCQGDCRVEGSISTPAGASVAGRCTIDSDRVGCHTTITGGKADPTLCID